MEDDTMPLGRNGWKKEMRDLLSTDGCRTRDDDRMRFIQTLLLGYSCIETIATWGLCV